MKQTNSLTTVNVSESSLTLSLRTIGLARKRLNINKPLFILKKKIITFRTIEWPSSFFN